MSENIKSEKYWSSTTYIFNPNVPWKEQTPLALPSFGGGEERFGVNSWSPDKRWLAGSALSGQSLGGIIVYSLKSQQYKRLTDFGSLPVWLQDSRRLLFWHHDEGVVFLVDRYSGERHEVLSLAPDFIWWPTISSDERWIYFSRLTHEADIWMLTLNEERK